MSIGLGLAGRDGVGLGLGTARGGAAAAIPSRWLVFDATNDYIVLPSSHGQEPSTAIFVEAWVKDLATGAGCIITRGDFYIYGYCFSINAQSDPYNLLMALSLDGVQLDGITANRGAHDTSLPMYLAAGWDGTTIYYFVNGVLVGTKAGTGTIAYEGNTWTIGDMLQGSPIWPFRGKLSQVRISNVCRHTASYTIPAALTADANTIGLWLCQEGSGTTLTDASSNTHNGTFKGSGEPAWGDAIDVSTLAWGDELWAACAAMIPAVTGVKVYVKRVDANNYYVYRKVHATGPYWTKFHFTRSTEAFLSLQGIWTGIPDPVGDVPSSWTTDPATQLLVGGASEYVLYGHVGAGADYQFGSGHGNEVRNSDGWYVDSVLTTLGNGDWANGDTIEYRGAGYGYDPAVGSETPVVNVSMIKKFTSSVMYLECSYTFDWLQDFVIGSGCYPVMTMYCDTNLSKALFHLGGTDYDVAGTGTVGYERSHVAAGWHPSNGAVLATYIDLDEGMRYCATGGGMNITQGLSKMYATRAQEINGALTGSQWAYSVRFMPLDNCGNHVLKTT